MLHFLVTLKISFGAKFFSAFITLYVLMACFVHIKLPLVFKDVGLFRAFSTDTNELSIPTRCVLCLLMVHQISLHYRTIVTIITTVNLLIVTITRILGSSILNPFRCLKMSNGEFYNFWQLKKSNGDRTKV